MKLQIANTDYNLEKKVLHMAILNLTPDSFSDGGRYKNLEEIDRFIHTAIDNNVDIIDVGGESTRPGAKKVLYNEEFNRTIPVINYLKANTDIHISIDTYKSELAEEALKSGAVIVNDISGGSFDKEMFSVASKYSAAMVIMHIKGNPQDMQKDPQYDHLFNEITFFLENQIAKARDAGLKNIIVDPGIGFGKQFSDNYKLISNLDFLEKLDLPVLIGASRKSFLQGDDQLPSDQREEGTIVAHTAAILKGARIVRSHDIVKTARMIKVCERILNC
jgi:dihydropteroate synthase